MKTLALTHDIEAVYQMADNGMPLAELMQAICSVLTRHPDALSHITGRYRITAVDTAYTFAFALESGVLSFLDDCAATTVTVIGKEADLLMVFQRKLPPLNALLRRKITVKGSKAALLELAAFL